MFDQNVNVTYARTSSEGLVLLAHAWTNYSLSYGEKINLYLDHDLGPNDDIMSVVDFLYVAENAAAKKVDTGSFPE